MILVIEDRAMKPEILDMYKRLQPLFREKMKELQTYDRIRCEKYPWVAFGSDCDYADDCCCIDRPCSSRILFPLPIDPRNPERGLWRMLDWSQFDAIVSRDGSNLIIRVWNSFKWVDKIRGIIEEALLMALCHQKGV